jgi:hypothetical protein
MKKRRPTPFDRFASRYPLTDRVTLYFDSRAGALGAVFTGLSMPLVGFVGRKLGMDSTMLTILGETPYVALLFNIWFGRLAEEGDKAAWVFWPSVIARGLVALVAFVVSPVPFLMVMGAYNILASISGPAYSGIMKANYSNRWRGEIMGNIRIMIQLIAGILSTFAGWFMEVHQGGYRILFPIAAAFGVANSIVFRRIKVREPGHGHRGHDDGSPSPDSRPARPAGLERPTGSSGSGQGLVSRVRFGLLETLATVGRDAPFLAFLVISFFMGIPDKFVIPLEPIRFVDELHMDYATAGLIQGTIPYAAALLGYAICARISNRVSPFVLLIAVGFLSSTRYLGTALATNSLHLIPGTFLNGLANAGWDLLPLFTILLLAGPSSLSLYMGVYNFLIGVRGILGPLVGTWMYQGLRLPIVDVYWLAFATEIVGTLALLVFTMKLRRGSGAPEGRTGGNP